MSGGISNSNMSRVTNLLDTLGKHVRKAGLGDTIDGDKDLKQNLENLTAAISDRSLTEANAKALCKEVGIKIPKGQTALNRLDSIISDFKTASVRSHIFNPEKSRIPTSNLASRCIVDYGITVNALIFATNSLATDHKTNAITGNTKPPTDAMNVLMCKIDSGSISSKDANTLLKDIAKRTDFDSDKTEFGSRRFKLGSNSENRKDLLMHLGFSDKDATKLSKNLRRGTLKAIVANFQDDVKVTGTAKKRFADTSPSTPIGRSHVEASKARGPATPEIPPFPSGMGLEESPRNAPMASIIGFDKMYATLSEVSEIRDLSPEELDTAKDSLRDVMTGTISAGLGISENKADALLSKYDPSNLAERLLYIMDEAKASFDKHQSSQAVHGKKLKLDELLKSMSPSINLSIAYLKKLAE